MSKKVLCVMALSIVVILSACSQPAPKSDPIVELIRQCIRAGGNPVSSGTTTRCEFPTTAPQQQQPVQPAQPAVPPAQPPSQQQQQASLDRYMLIYRSSQQLGMARCLTATGGEAVGADCNGSDNQMWAFQPAGVYYELIAKSSNRCLTVKGGSQIAVAHFVEQTCRGSDDQLYRQDKLGDWMQLVNREQGQCIDVRAFDPTPQSEIILSPCWNTDRDNTINDNDNQVWLKSSTTYVQPNTIPPPGVYVTNIEVIEVGCQQGGNKKCYVFRVTFTNTSGVANNYRWAAYVYRSGERKSMGQSYTKEGSLGGILDADGWGVGCCSQDYIVKIHWLRPGTEPIPLRDPLGRIASATFRY